jgi:ribokinase
MIIMFAVVISKTHIIIPKKFMITKKIVVIGSCNTDMVVKSDRLPVPGETILGGAFMMNPGGKGANQAVAVARLGGNVTFISKTGNDLFGKQSIEMFGDENINTDYIFSDPQLPSGVALIMVDTYGENCIVVASGANASLSKEDIEKARYLIEDADILLMQLEIPMETVEYAASLAYKKGIKVVLNPAPASFLSTGLLECLYAIVPNKTEAEMLSGIKVSDQDSAKQAADIISSKGVDIVVITLGSAGAFIKDGNNYYNVPVEKIKAVDTTAAGDTFCGALCVAISEGLSIEEAVKFANKASGFTVMREGAQSAIPYRKELGI